MHHLKEKHTIFPLLRCCFRFIFSCAEFFLLARALPCSASPTRHISTASERIISERWLVYRCVYLSARFSPTSSSTPSRFARSLRSFICLLSFPFVCLYGRSFSTLRCVVFARAASSMSFILYSIYLNISVILFFALFTWSFRRCITCGFV